MLNRFDGSQDFVQNFNAYKEGFGDLKGEFWLGESKICQVNYVLKNKTIIQAFLVS